jgi:predicted metalloprotease
MKWEGQRESDNVEDARGGGGGRGLPIGGRGSGWAASSSRCWPPGFWASTL